MGRAKRQRKRKNIRSEEPEEYNHVLNLIKWLHVKRMQFKVLEFNNAGRGVISNKMVRSGDELFAVPLEAMVTVDVVNRSTIPQIFPSCKFSPQMAITFWLVYESHLKNSSKYYFYLNVLPKSFNSLLFCSEIELNALPDWIKTPVDVRLKEAKDGYDGYFSSIKETSCDHCNVKYCNIFTYERFLWAWSCVNTRCVYYEDEKLTEDGKSTLTSSIALAPFLDFFNHSNSAEVEAKLDCQRGVYSLKTNKPFKKYDQIFIKYGAFPNLKLLVEYGFILDDDDQDIVEFTFEDVLRAVKYVSPKYADISKLKYKFITINSLNVKLTKGRDEFSWNCNGLLYILVTQDTNLADLLSKTYSSTWSEKEMQLIKQIQNRMIEQKYDELASQLIAMEMVQPCSDGFRLAKDLVKLYIKILRN